MSAKKCLFYRMSIPTSVRILDLKRYVLLFVVTFFFIPFISAQKVNSRGQKMVSKITICEYREDGSPRNEIEWYSFTYNESGDLKMVHYYWELPNGNPNLAILHSEKTLTKAANKIKIQFLEDHKPSKDYSYEGRLDENGYLTKYSENCHGLDGSILRNDAELEYVGDYLHSVTYCWWYKGPVSNGKWHKGDGEDYYDKFSYEYLGDSVTISRTWGHNGHHYKPSIVNKQNSFSQHINDTNINLNVLIADSWGGINHAIEDLMMTEWCGQHNCSLLLSSRYSTYNYIKESGNLIEIKVNEKYFNHEQKKWDCRLVCRYLIEYVK